MNYLAHLFLAEENDDAKLGALLGDFVKGTIIDRYSEKTEREIQIHRKIDFYTDNHAIVKDAKKLLSVEKRKYGNILLDVFYDHMLAQKWQDYSKISLENYTKQIYSILLSDMDVLPDKLRDIVPIMIDQNWLTSYREFRGFEMAIARISRRLRQENSLMECVAEIETNYSSIALSFDNFFPQLMDYVKQERILLDIVYSDRIIL
ncbi:MAG: ACP phosphodiesterase [Pseudanabaena sp.]